LWHVSTSFFSSLTCLIFFFVIPRPPISTLFPYTTLFRSALCFDTWMFGERATRTELDTFKHMLWHGRVLWGMMVYDSLKAVDYLDRKSTRLNSSHVKISYAVFCLKKKKI